jgi:hypothetical protein
MWRSERNTKDRLSPSKEAVETTLLISCVTRFRELMVPQLPLLCDAACEVNAATRRTLEVGD